MGVRQEEEIRGVQCSGISYLPHLCISRPFLSLPPVNSIYIFMQNRVVDSLSHAVLFGPTESSIHRLSMALLPRQADLTQLIQSDSNCLHKHR